MPQTSRSGELSKGFRGFSPMLARVGGGAPLFQPESLTHDQSLLGLDVHLRDASQHVLIGVRNLHSLRHNLTALERRVPEGVICDQSLLGALFLGVQKGQGITSFVGHGGLCQGGDGGECGSQGVPLEVSAVREMIMKKTYL